MTTAVEVYRAMPAKSEFYDIDGSPTVVLAAGAEGFSESAVAFWVSAVPAGWRVSQPEPGTLYLHSA